jgi:ubiquinone/menaquinone biosynthesis C-methylase UbiE
MHNLPVRDESFDACICSETLEHLPDDKKAVSEIYRVLKPGGRLIFTVPNLLAVLGLKARLKHYLREKSWLTHPNHLREYTVPSAKKLIRDHFVVERCFPVGFTLQTFRESPYKKIFSRLVEIPALTGFSLSHAWILKKKNGVRV